MIHDQTNKLAGTQKREIITIDITIIIIIIINCYIALQLFIVASAIITIKH